MGYGFNVPWAWGDRMMEALIRVHVKGESPADAMAKVAPHMAEAMWDGFSPVSSGTWIQALAPTGAVPFVQIAENKAWHGGPVMPEGNPFDPAPPPDSEKKWKSVSPLAEGVASKLNEWTGGNKYRAGWFSTSPESLENVWEGYTGGLGKMMENGYKLLTKPWSETGWTKVPVIRRFYSDNTMFADRGNFYTNVEEVHRSAREVDKMGEDAPERAHTIAPLLESAKAHTKEVKNLRDAREESTDSKERAALEADMQALFLQFNKEFNARRWLRSQKP
jgi:hypothetical protein